MKNLKFRAWDKKNNVWIKPQFGGTILVGEDNMIAICHNKPNNNGGYTAQQPVLMTWGEAENIGIMQFTGLKDKNGKEIYEGDIIKCTIYQREQVICADELVEVKFENGCFYPFGYSTGWRSSVENIEVIGNIFSNPELLK